MALLSQTQDRTIKKSSLLLILEIKSVTAGLSASLRNPFDVAVFLLPGGESGAAAGGGSTGAGGGCGGT